MKLIHQVNDTRTILQRSPEQKYCWGKYKTKTKTKTQASANAEVNFVGYIDDNFYIYHYATLKWVISL